MEEGIEKMIEGAKKTAVSLTKGYEGKKENTKNSLIQAGISLGVYVFFSSFVDGPQPVIEIGALTYTALKVYHAAKDYRSK